MRDGSPQVSPESRESAPDWSVRGSGDPRADRRYVHAREALAAGDATAAADLVRQALDYAPDWPPAWMLLGEAERAAGGDAPAIAAFREVLARDPADRLGAGLGLAGLGVGDPAVAMSELYVTALFDEYAPTFARHLTVDLGYRGPGQIVDLLETLQLAGPGQVFRRVLDLGCGTGLMGEALAGRARHIEGCDLSSAMVALARSGGFYAEVVVADAARFLDGHAPGAADLVTAADVLVYVGDVAPLFAAAARALGPGGCFAFTLQTGPDVGFELGDDLRFRHAPSYIAGIARGAGLAVVAEEAIHVRLDRGVKLAGAAIVCRRAAT